MPSRRPNSARSDALEEVAIAVRQMDEMTQHTTALVEKINAAIEQTEVQADELDRIVAEFRCGQLSVMPKLARPAARLLKVADGKRVRP